MSIECCCQVIAGMECLYDVAGTEDGLPAVKAAIAVAHADPKHFHTCIHIQHIKKEPFKCLKNGNL